MAERIAILPEVAGLRRPSLVDIGLTLAQHLPGQVVSIRCRSAA